MMSFILFKFCCLIFLLTGSLSKVQSAPQESGVCNLACTRGYHCEICSAGNPQCVPDAPAYNGGNSCETIRCPAGTICQQGNIQCFAAPCPQPTPSCVPISGDGGLSCSTVLCSPGTYCHQDTIYCFRAPCPQPPPKCLPCGPPVDVADPGYGLESRSAFAMNPCPVG